MVFSSWKRKIFSYLFQKCIGINKTKGELLILSQVKPGIKEVSNSYANLHAKVHENIAKP